MQAREITEMLAGWRDGDRAAADRLLPLIRAELLRLARRHLGRERNDHSMQPSSLVQEAFLRLLPGVDAGWRDRAHFFAVASQVMRHILVDYAREKRREKRLVRGVAPAEADLALFQPHQPVIGNGDAVRVIAEILELTDIRDYGREITRRPACTGWGRLPQGIVLSRRL